MRTVLVSVSDKSGLTDFLRKLERFDDLRIVATRSTAAFLIEQRFQCVKVEELTNFPEILGGRVKTLHPKVLAGVLARPSEEDRSCLAQLDILPIDIVVVNLYPFEKRLSEALSEAQMVEEIDVGGVTLIRAAAKNFERVAVVCDPAQYPSLIESLEKTGGNLDIATRRRLAHAAFQRTADYDRAISAYLESLVENGAGKAAQELPCRLTLDLSCHQSLRYGENPHQVASWYAPPAVTRAASAVEFPPFQQLQGKELSFNNIVDTHALLRILREFSGQQASCIIKHNNPCGVAVDDDLESAFEKAYQCDPVSAFGGIYGFTGTVTEKLAERMTRDFVEIVAAPEFESGCTEVFARKKNLRVLRLAPESLTPPEDLLQFKDLGDFGFLVQKDNQPPVEARDFRTVTRASLDPSYLPDVQFTWSVQRHLTSNAIFIARHGLSLGFGIGQTNRVGSVRIALAQAGERAKGAVLASDAFFPAPDSIEAAAEAGIKVIVQPGGSIKDEEVIAACDRAGMVMLFTGQRCFKH